MELACLDLEGVLIPEIWIGFAEKTGIDELKATTRDIPDYDVLMKQRLAILDKHKLGLPDIQEVIATMAPLPGANDFVDWLKERFQLIILSDTFYEFSHPLMRQLDFPTLFCHRLVANESGAIVDYKLRQEDPKRQCVKAFHGLNFRVIAAGDSYNDTTMLSSFKPGPLAYRDVWIALLCGVVFAGLSAWMIAPQVMVSEGLQPFLAPNFGEYCEVLGLWTESDRDWNIQALRRSMAASVPAHLFVNAFGVLDGLATGAPRFAAAPTSSVLKATNTWCLPP